MRSRSGLGFVSALVTLVGAAHGQDAPPRPEDQRPPLQGPRVPQNRPPHVDDEFGGGMKEGKERRGMAIPMRAYAEVIGKLRGENAPQDLRLSEDQEHKVGAIEQEFREAAKEFAQKMREDRGQRPPQGEAPGKGERPRREMVDQFAKNGPRPADYQTRIWAVLNPKQQDFVKRELDKVTDEMQKRRGEEYVQRRLDQRKGPDGKQDGKQDAKPDAKPGEQRPGEGTPMRERAQRIMRRMQQLPADERERILKKLEEELDRRGIPDGPPPDAPAPK